MPDPKQIVATFQKQAEEEVSFVDQVLVAAVEGIKSKMPGLYVSVYDNGVIKIKRSGRASGVPLSHKGEFFLVVSLDHESPKADLEVIES